MTKTASEIVESAMHLAGTYNLDFLTSQMLLSELNDAYRKVYDEIAESDNDYFIQEYRADTNHFALPCDLYKIKTVAFLNPDGSWSPILRQPPKQFIPGYYYIENNCFHYNGEVMRPIQIRYVPQPCLITMPRESVALDIPKVSKWGKMTDEGVYFMVDSESYYLDFNDYTTSVSEFIEYTPEIQGEDVVIDYEEQTVKTETTDYTDVFTSDCHGNFVNIVFDCPYAMVSYEDGTIVLYQNMQPCIWNIEDVKGHGTKGIVHALSTNDTTLYGCIYENKRDGRYYHSSFVPDTVLSYPKNTLWKYMETSLAVILMAINGIDNKYVTETLLEEAKLDFKKDLERDRDNVFRITNLTRKRWYR